MEDGQLMSIVFDRIAEIVVSSLGVDPALVTPQAHFLDDLGGDSLDAAEIQLDVEEEFGIEITDDEAEGVATVADLVRVVDTHLSRTVERS